MVQQKVKFKNFKLQRQFLPFVKLNHLLYEGQTVNQHFYFLFYYFFPLRIKQTHFSP
jgi:hypothetical protein